MPTEDIEKLIEKKIKDDKEKSSNLNFRILKGIGGLIIALAIPLMGVIQFKFMEDYLNSLLFSQVFIQGYLAIIQIGMILASAYIGLWSINQIASEEESCQKKSN